MQSIYSQEILRSIDYASFKLAKGLSYLEVYYSIQRNALKFAPKNNRYEALFGINTKIFKNDTLITQESWNNIDYADSLNQITDTQRISNISAFQIFYGNYKLVVTVTDSNSNRTSEYSLNMPVKNYESRQLMMSDVQLSTNIVQSKGEEGRFVKNGYRIIPNAENLYGMNISNLFFYTEIYNLDFNPTQPSTYTVQYSILSSDSVEVKKFPPKTRSKPGASCVEVAGFSIATLRSATYYLVLNITDDATKNTVKQIKRFYIYRPGDFPEGQKVDIGIRKPSVDLGNEYLVMNEKEVEERFDEVKYIATEEEKSRYKGLNLQGKRTFWGEFWAKRQEGSFGIGQIKSEYYRRLKFVNQEFSGVRKGWRTDRGRIYLIYGSPNDIERYPSSTENKPYEIWHYHNIEGGVIFVFADKQGYGEYELIHSTAKRELHDENWIRWVRTAESSGIR
jgi:GWxTD domain-containing protein